MTRAWPACRPCGEALRGWPHSRRPLRRPRRRPWRGAATARLCRALRCVPFPVPSHAPSCWAGWPLAWTSFRRPPPWRPGPATATAAAASKRCSLTCQARERQRWCGARRPTPAARPASSPSRDAGPVCRAVVRQWCRASARPPDCCSQRQQLPYWPGLGSRLSSRALIGWGFSSTYLGAVAPLCCWR